MHVLCRNLRFIGELPDTCSGMWGKAGVGAGAISHAGCWDKPSGCFLPEWAQNDDGTDSDTNESQLTANGSPNNGIPHSPRASISPHVAISTLFDDLSLRRPANTRMAWAVIAAIWWMVIDILFFWHRVSPVLSCSSPIPPPGSILITLTANRNSWPGSPPAPRLPSGCPSSARPPPMRTGKRRPCTSTTSSGSTCGATTPPLDTMTTASFTSACCN
jgi:hypothetical protein